MGDETSRRGRRDLDTRQRAVFGGTADSVALWFKSQGHKCWFYYYLTGMIGISLVVYAKADSAMHRHK